MRRDEGCGRRSGRSTGESAVVLALALGFFATSGLAGTVTRLATQDTWIEGLGDHTPPVPETRLGICPGANYWIFLGFDLTALGGEIETAELRMTRFNGDRPDEISVYFMHDDDWSEATLTGLNRPDPQNPANTDALGVGEDPPAAPFDRWVSSALTDRIALEAAGDGTLTLMLRENPVPMNDIRYYNSTEAAVAEGAKPQLVLEVTPPEVASLAVLSASPADLSWPSAWPGAEYDVITGRLADLRADGGVDAAFCLAEDLTTSSYSDVRPDPPPGECDWWLVRAVTVAGAGSWGSDSAGNPRLPLVDCAE